MDEHQTEPAWSFEGKFEGSRRTLSRTSIQVHILEEVRAQVPAVLADLAGHPLDMYGQVPTHRDEIFARYATTPAQVAARQSMSGGTSSLPGWMEAGAPWRWSSVTHRARFHGSTAFEQLHTALSEWAQRWFKDEPEWLMNTALEVIHRWRSGYTPADARLWFYPNDFDYLNPPVEIQETAFRFEHPGWTMTHSQDAWKKDCLKRFQEARDEYLRTMEDIAVNSGYVEAPDVRSTWHVPAFVKFQVLDWSKRDIANIHPYDVTIDAVDKALRKVARSADIRLRKKKKAGPKKPQHVTHPVRTGITATPR